MTIADFDALPPDVGPDLATREHVRQVIARFRSTTLPELATVDLDRPLATVTTSRRAARAFEALRLTTVGQFLACPREKVLAVTGFGIRSWQAVVATIAATMPPPIRSLDLEWLPDSIRRLRLSDLELDPPTRASLAATGAVTLADLLLGRGPTDENVQQAVRASVGRTFRCVLAAEGAGLDPFPLVLRRLRGGLGETDRRLFDAILGIGRRATTPARAGMLLRLPADEAEDLADALRARVVTEATDEITAITRSAYTDLETHEGIVGIEDLAVGSPLHVAAHSGPDPALPLRLLAFVHVDRWCFEAERLCAVPTGTMRDVVRAVRSALASARPPVRVADIAKSLEPVGAKIGSGLLMHVLRRVLGHSLSLHAEHGEVVVCRRASVSARIEVLLEDSDTPLALDDVLFRYRDRYRAGSRRRIFDALHGTGPFLEVGADQWSLRARHIDELELLRPEAQRIAEELRTTGARLGVRDAARRGEMSERSAFLLADLLRRESGLRDLGRGEFLARRRSGSRLVDGLVAEFRRAMGEVPLARFLQNQQPRRQRIVARILRSNRLFVAPSPDRIDLLENYPFGVERLQILLREVSNCVEENGGYASLRRVREAVLEAELGGSFLTDHLLLDILRRHGRFELLPGPWIAAPDVSLGPWIQRTIRDILRSRDTSMTFEQILVERPELAEFSDCLGELLDQDPLVQSEDGLHYQVV